MEYRNLDSALECMRRYDKEYEYDPIKAMEFNGEPMVELAFSLPVLSRDVNALIPWDGQNHEVKKITVLLRGLIDIVASIDGYPWIVDHKTTSMGGPGFFNEFRLSAQMISYIWVVKQLYKIDPMGALINAIVSRRPTEKGKGKQFEFMRERYTYSQDHIDEWLSDFASNIDNYIDRLVNNDWPKFTKSCQGKYGACEYFNVCTLPKDSRGMELSCDDYRDVTTMGKGIEVVKEEVQG